MITEKWVTQEEAEGNLGIYPESSNDCIAVVWGCESNADAHARLIAAAPDLLAACKMAQIAIANWRDNKPIVFDGKTYNLEEVKYCFIDEAIAAATNN